jgi:hypothetical protein
MFILLVSRRSRLLEVLNSIICFERYPYTKKFSSQTDRQHKPKLKYIRIRKNLVSDRHKNRNYNIVGYASESNFLENVAGSKRGHTSYTVSLYQVRTIVHAPLPCTAGVY